MKEQKLAILGGGNMGRAFIGALLRQGLRPELISVGEQSEPARSSLVGEFGILASADNAVAIRDAQLIVVAVKPQDIPAVIPPLRQILQLQRPLVLSIAAGIRVAALQALCGAGTPIVRAMPNRPALLGAGATALFAPPEVSEAHRELAANAMRATGTIVWVKDEDALDVVTALSGSGPAYFFLVAELMERAAVELGLEPDAARRLTVQTLYGAGLMAHVSDGDFARLRAEVTSRGGTTEAALRVLEEAQLPRLLAQAVTAAATRSQELAAHFGPEPPRASGT